MAATGTPMITGFFRGMAKGMQRFGHSISMVVNTFLLSVVYVLGVGVTSVVAKIVGKKFLDGSSSQEKTYWTTLNATKERIDHYFRQF